MTEETTENNEATNEPIERIFKKWDRANSPVCEELREEHNDAVKKIFELQAQLEESTIAMSECISEIDKSRAKMQSVVNEVGESIFMNLSNSRGQWLGTVYLSSDGTKISLGKNWHDGLKAENKRANDNERMVIKLKEMLIKERCRNCKDFKSGKMECSSEACSEFKKQLSGTPHTVLEKSDD